MAPPQQASVEWATRIVIKWVRVHHTPLPRPPSLRLHVFHIIVHCLKLLRLQLMHVHLVILLLMLLRLMLDIRLDNSTTFSGTLTPRRNNTFLHHPLGTLSPTGSMPCLPYALSRGGTLCNMHTTQSAQTQYKSDTENKYWVFPDFIFRIATIQSGKRNPDCYSAEEKNSTNYLHA
jgi:hypothetical protein